MTSCYTSLLTSSFSMLLGSSSIFHYFNFCFLYHFYSFFLLLIFHSRVFIYLNEWGCGCPLRWTDRLPYCHTLSESFLSLTDERSSAEAGKRVCWLHSTHCRFFSYYSPSRLSVWQRNANFSSSRTKSEIAHGKCVHPNALFALKHTRLHPRLE
jgi:hypothetical protein